MVLHTEFRVVLWSFFTKARQRFKANIFHSEQNFIETEVAADVHKLTEESKLDELTLKWEDISRRRSKRGTYLIMSKWSPKAHLFFNNTKEVTSFTDLRIKTKHIGSFNLRDRMRVLCRQELFFFQNLLNDKCAWNNFFARNKITTLFLIRYNNGT